MSALAGRSGRYLLLYGGALLLAIVVGAVVAYSERFGGDNGPYILLVVLLAMRRRRGDTVAVASRRSSAGRRTTFRNCNKSRTRGERDEGPGVTDVRLFRAGSAYGPEALREVCEAVATTASPGGARLCALDFGLDLVGL